MNTTKNQIFQTAQKLFLEKGYDNVTIDEICQACQITKSTFYYHIQSKQDILVYHYDALVNNIQHILVNMLTQNDYRKQLSILFDGLIDNIIKCGIDFNKQALIISLKENLKTFDIRQELQKIGENIIRNGQESGQFSSLASPSEIYEACCYLFFGYEIKWTLENGDLDWKKKFNHAVDLILGYQQKS